MTGGDDLTRFAEGLMGWALTEGRPNRPRRDWRPRLWVCAGERVVSSEPTGPLADWLEGEEVAALLAERRPTLLGCTHAVLVEREDGGPPAELVRVVVADTVRHTAATVPVRRSRLRAPRTDGRPEWDRPDVVDRADLGPTLSRLLRRRAVGLDR